MNTPASARFDDSPFLQAAAWAWLWRSFDIGLPDGVAATEAIPTAPPASQDSSASLAPVTVTAPAVHTCLVRRRLRSARCRRDHQVGPDALE